MKEIYSKPKRAFFVILSIVFLLFAVINSCKKEEKQTQQDLARENLISKAKDWYQKSYPKNSDKNIVTKSVGTTDNVDFSQFTKPDWDKSASYLRFNKETLEIPISNQDTFLTVIKPGLSSFSNQQQKYSRSSLLILNDGGNYSAYIMTIIADSIYLKNDFSKLGNNTYKKRDKDFSGTVLYFTPKGVFVSGWFYSKGAVTKKLSAGSSVPTNGVQNLKTNIVKPLTEVCTDWYADYYYNDQLISSDYLGRTCTDDGGGGGGGLGDYDDDNGFPPPGGGATNPEPPLVADTLKLGRICDNLTIEQKSTIITNVNSFTTHDCATKFLTKNLKSKISSFCITDLGPNPPNARYNATTGEIDFQSEYAATDLESLEHEIFHAFQDQTYGHATYLSYGTLLPGNVYPSGFIDVEFEQAVFEDIVNKTHYGTLNSNDPAFIAAYRDWINSITSNGTTYPKLNPQTDITQYNNFISQYQSFLSQYQQIIGNPYYSPITNYTPNALINMFNSIDPNNC